MNETLTFVETSSKIDARRMWTFHPDPETLKVFPQMKQFEGAEVLLGRQPVIFWQADGFDNRAVYFAFTPLAEAAKRLKERQERWPTKKFLLGPNFSIRNDNGLSVLEFDPLAADGALGIWKMTRQKPISPP